MALKKQYWEAIKPPISILFSKDYPMLTTDKYCTRFNARPRYFKLLITVFMRTRYEFLALMKRLYDFPYFPGISISSHSHKNTPPLVILPKACSPKGNGSTGNFQGRGNIYVFLEKSSIRCASFGRLWVTTKFIPKMGIK